MIALQTTRRLATDVLAGVSPSLLTRMTRARLVIPYYHVVTDEDLWHVKHLYGYKSPKQFIEDLEFLLRYYSPIGLPDLLDHVKRGRALPSRALLLTFDDGFREMNDVVAPILSAKGVSATFFVNSAFIDNVELCYLNKASLLIEHVRTRASRAASATMVRLLERHQVRARDLESGIRAITYETRAVLDELVAAADVDVAGFLADHQPYLTSAAIQTLIARGFHIGAHSVDHPLYASLPLDEQVSQTVTSVTTIRSRFRLPYGAFAFPHSDHGVSKEYFQRVAATGTVDLSFGEAGLLGDSVVGNLQRFSLENPLEPAPRILAYHHARRLGKMLTGQARVTRQ
jgi:peptidoglycan/xylan/chitin deacetylase (PgdA/CDA1 family)